jgi:hypothetical protein
MRIGVLTIHRAVNNGAMLQAYATCTLLSRAFPGVRAEVIDYFPSKGIRKEARLQLRGRTPTRVLRGMRAILQTYRFTENCLPLSEERLMSDDCELATRFVEGKYDLILVGSDVVFEIKPPGRAYIPPPPNAYFLPPEVTAVKVGFAASADGSDLSLLTPKVRAAAKRSLDGFALLGVREQFTADLVVELGADPAKIRLVPDPTFGLDLMPTNARNRLRRAGVDFDRPRLGINLNRGALSSAVIDHYRRKGYQIVALMHHPEADVSLHGLLSPLEWAEAPRHLSLTITDRFHGTLFALKNLAPVLSLDVQAEYRDPKVESKKRSLLESCGLSLCHVGPTVIDMGHDEVIRRAERVEREFDSDTLEAALRRQRDRLLEYLQEVRSLVTLGSPAVAR